MHQLNRRTGGSGQADIVCAACLGNGQGQVWAYARTTRKYPKADAEKTRGGRPETPSRAESLLTG